MESSFLFAAIAMIFFTSGEMLSGSLFMSIISDISSPKNRGSYIYQTIRINHCLNFSNLVLSRATGGPMRALLAFVVFAAAGVSYSHNLANHNQFEGCKHLRMYLDIGWLSGDKTEETEMGKLYRALCRFTPENNSTVYYPNGEVATHYANKVGATWYYSNKEVATHYAGKADATFYYSNKEVLTHYVAKVGATIYYPNKEVLTHYWGKKNTTWYYPNKEVITHYAGKIGASWYYSNKQPISHYMGKAKATWYYPDGQTWMYEAPAVSEDRLLDVLGFLREILDENS